MWCCVFVRVRNIQKTKFAFFISVEHLTGNDSNSSRIVEAMSFKTSFKILRHSIFGIFWVLWLVQKSKSPQMTFSLPLEHWILNFVDSILTRCVCILISYHECSLCVSTSSNSLWTNSLSSNSPECIVWIMHDWTSYSGDFLCVMMYFP